MKKVTIGEVDPNWIRDIESESGEKSSIFSELKDLTKRRYYVSSPEEVPEQYEVQEGEQGGLYYEPDDMVGDTSGGETGEDEPTIPDDEEELNEMQEEFIEEHPEMYSTLYQLNSKMGARLTHNFLRNAAKVLDHIEPDTVEQASALFLSDGREPDTPIGLEKAKEGLQLAKDVQRVVRTPRYIERGRRYVDDPDEVPEGYEVQEGPQGGIYYEIDENGEGEEDGRWFDVDEIEIQEGMHVRDDEGEIWEVEDVGHLEGIGPTIRGVNSDGETTDFFPGHDDDIQSVYAGDDDPTDPSEEWVPYVNQQGERGYLNTETGEFDEGAKTPPVDIEGEDVSPDNPLQEGDFVRLEYDDEVHYGFVYTDRGNGDMVVIDDRHRWDVPKEGFSEGDSLHGSMEVERIGQPEDETVDPEDVEIDSPRDVTYVLDELPTEGIDRVADALQSGTLSVEEVKEGAEESWGMLSIGSELLERGGVAETSEGKVSLESGMRSEGEEEQLREGFRQRVDEDTAYTVARAARGWEQGMYQDRKAAPAVQYAMTMTENNTLPEYERSDEAAEWDVDSEEIEAMEAISDYTTEQLREAFGDEVTVFRGFAKDPHQGTPSEGTDVVDMMEQAKESGESVTIEHRPVESWSLNPEVASLYGAGGAVVKQTVPVEEILMSSSTGFPHESEEDTLLMHDGDQEYDPDQIILDEQRNDEEMKFELRAEAVKEAG